MRGINTATHATQVVYLHPVGYRPHVNHVGDAMGQLINIEPRYVGVPVVTQFPGPQPAASVRLGLTQPRDTDLDWLAGVVVVHAFTQGEER